MPYLNKILKLFLFSFLGIEDKFWSQLSQVEKQKFYRITFYIILMIVFVLLGMYEFFILLTNKILISITFSIILSIIIINIIRFSIFTIQNPIYKDIESESKIKQVNTISTENTTSTISASTVIDKFKKIFALFSFGLFIRLIINGILLLFISLPFSCFLNNTNINKINIEKRDNLIINYEFSKKREFSEKCSKLNQKIILLNKKNRDNSNAIYKRELKEEIILKNELINEWELKKNIEIKKYNNSIINKNFIIYSYKYNSQSKSFYFSFFIGGFLLLFIHLEKFQLINNLKYSYYKTANQFSYSVSLENYNEVEKSIKTELKKKYFKNKFYEQLIKNYELSQNNNKYLNPPFNSVKKDFKRPLERLSIDAFINIFRIK